MTLTHSQIAGARDRDVWPCEGTVMSNADHSIDYKAAEKLKGRAVRGQYAGYNFCGYIWWTGSQWACDVWVHHRPDAVVYAATLDEIMQTVCSEYGSD